MLRLFFPFRWGAGVAVAPVAPLPTPDPLALAIAAERLDSLARQWQSEGYPSGTSWDAAPRPVYAFQRVEQLAMSMWSAVAITPGTWSRVE